MKRAKNILAGVALTFVLTGGAAAAEPAGMLSTWNLPVW